MLWLTIPGRGGSRPPPPPPPPPPPAPAPVRAVAGGQDRPKQLRQQRGLGGGTSSKAALAPAQTTNKTLLGN